MFCGIHKLINKQKEYIKSEEEWESSGWLYRIGDETGEKRTQEERIIKVNIGE